jgi:hypothetical protein
MSQNERKFVDMTSLTVEEFNQLVPTFEKAFQERMKDWCLDGKKRLRHKYTTYINCPLPTPEDRLFFILVYVQTNVQQAVQGELFGMPQNKANQWIKTLLPVLQTTLGKLENVPTRSLEELAQRLKLHTMGTSPVESEGQSLNGSPDSATMIPNVPKVRMNRKAIIAARKRATP